MTLHTWGQSLSLHTHIHCIVPGGGVDYRGRWKEAKGKGKYLFPVKVMSKLFRVKMICRLKEWLQEKGMEYTEELQHALYKKDWVVYCKQPFGGGKGVVEYLARYTYKTAISNHRIVSKDKTHVVIRYKDYRHGGIVKHMRLSKTEFIRRFSLHILPKGFTRIRHYGILSGRLKHQLFATIKVESTQAWDDYWLENRLNIIQCPYCKTGKLMYIKELPKRGPPYSHAMNQSQSVS